MNCSELKKSVVKCKSLFFKLCLIYAPDVVDSYQATLKVSEAMPDDESKTCIWELYYLWYAVHYGDYDKLFEHLDNIRKKYLSALYHLQANVNYHFELN